MLRDLLQTALVVVAAMLLISSCGTGAGGTSTEEAHHECMREYREQSLEGVEPPNPVSKVQPRAGAAASGWACVSAVVGVTGGVVSVELVSASEPVFGRNAIAAARRWTFEPATLDGEPVESSFRLFTSYRRSSHPLSLSLIAFETMLGNLFQTALVVETCCGLLV